jgi:hypothetical protein
MEQDLAQLARHLSARLEELEDGCILLRGWERAADGQVTARFPGQDAAALARRVADCVPVRCEAEEPDILHFWLTPNDRFEELDAIWGVLFESIS